MTQLKITDDLDALLDVLPLDIRHAVERANDTENLLEIILDLGRVPTARFVDHEINLRETEVSHAEIDYVDERTGEFDADNRAGIERTLHRISAIRNRRAAVVGLTLRVGRAVYGTVDIIQDIVESGKSVLILGRPGDGDVPHPAVGKARRMQVREPMLQHEVMIEAVENHNPEVIVIDEIGREAEAAAARTIAERGVQLIGTAHGQTLDNLLLNPTLSDLVGGIEAVTLSDEEARRRGTQKTVLERRAPPTFDVLIEIVTRDRFAVHQDIMASVDALLRGFPLLPQIRTRDEKGNIQIEKAAPPTSSRLDAKETKTPSRRGRQSTAVAEEPLPISMRLEQSAATRVEPSRGGLQSIKVYPHGVARNRLAQAAKRLGVPVVVVKDVSEANTLVTLKTYYRDRQQTIVDAEHRGMPIYVLRANTVSQMEQFLTDLFNLSSQQFVSSDMDSVKEQTQQAISAVLNGERWVDLPPGPSLVRRLQHEMARNAELVSHSYGKEPRRHVRIFRE